MNPRHLLSCVWIGGFALTLPLLSQDAKGKAPSAGQQAMMDAWQKAATPGANHQLLASLAGRWTFSTKIWMQPGASPETSTGTAVYTALMDGRFIQGDYKGTFGGVPFQGLGLTGYDNVAKHFTATWADNMGTSIMLMPGHYNPATKAFTYKGDMDDMMKPGKKVKVRQVVKIQSDDAHTMEWFETRGGKEVKTMEIAYLRQK
jgi:hypothetical protein